MSSRCWPGVGIRRNREALAREWIRKLLAWRSCSPYSNNSGAKRRKWRCKWRLTKEPLSDYPTVSKCPFSAWVSSNIEQSHFVTLSSRPLCPWLPGRAGHPVRFQSIPPILWDSASVAVPVIRRGNQRETHARLNPLGRHRHVKAISYCARNWYQEQ